MIKIAGKFRKILIFLRTISIEFPRVMASRFFLDKLFLIFNIFKFFESENGNYQLFLFLNGN